MPSIGSLKLVFSLLQVPSLALGSSHSGTGACSSGRGLSAPSSTWLSRAPPGCYSASCAFGSSSGVREEPSILGLLKTPYKGLGVSCSVLCSPPSLVSESLLSIFCLLSLFNRSSDSYVLLEQQGYSHWKEYPLWVLESIQKFA